MKKLFLPLLCLLVSASAFGAQPLFPEAVSGASNTPTTTQRLEQQGLVDVGKMDSTLIVRMVYATADNFTGMVLYEDLDRPYLQPEVAEKLLKASEILRRERPELRIIVYDAARPISVQRRMWKLVSGTPQNIYVSNPNKGGGLHNYAAAVDVTLADKTGTPLDMGTAFDHFGPEAHIDKEKALVTEGKITPEALENRLLLRSVMTRAGFLTLQNEWWHFNSLPLQDAKTRYKLIE